MDFSFAFWCISSLQPHQKTQKYKVSLSTEIIQSTFSCPASGVSIPGHLTHFSKEEWTSAQRKRSNLNIPPIQNLVLGPNVMVTQWKPEKTHQPTSAQELSSASRVAQCSVCMLVSEHSKVGLQVIYFLAQKLSNLIKHSITLYTFL